MKTFAVTTTLKRPVRLAPRACEELHAIKNHILGSSYTLSLVFIGDARSRTLNRRYRGTDRSTNVLSFPLSPAEGELCIAFPLARREASRYNRPASEHLRALFIHGCLHLKGHRHGATMDKEEKRLQKKFLSARRVR